MNIKIAATINIGVKNLHSVANLFGHAPVEFDGVFKL
jgi:hypothetical protein